jgi:hypothetical protein
MSESTAVLIPALRSTSATTIFVNEHIFESAISEHSRHVEIQGPTSKTPPTNSRQNTSEENARYHKNICALLELHNSHFGNH